MPPKRAKPLKVFDSASQFQFIVTRLPAAQLPLLACAIRRLRWLRRRWYFLQDYQYHYIG